jgi:N-acetylneuraminic acid mutarotase
MPFQKGRNHAATGTDGQKVYVFGGRGVGSGSNNVVANGFDHVQIYDPATNTWSASFDPGSTIAPLPIGRGGTGKAVFYKGEFYVIGGETLNGPGAQPGNVYNRVDVYDPVTNTWRLEAKLPTARHGVFPVIYQGKIYVAGGGVNAGFSNSNVLEIYSRQ